MSNKNITDTGLCIGGPRDGERLFVHSDQDSFIVPVFKGGTIEEVREALDKTGPLVSPIFETTRYYREVFIEKNGDRFLVWRHEEVAAEELLQILIRGYRNKK